MATWRELTFPIDPLGNAPLVIEDDRANIIIDPLRWRILEILGSGKSVAEISKALSVTDARILYHLKRLAEIEVVHLEEQESGAGKSYCSPIASTIRVREPLSAKDKDSAAIPENVVNQFNQAFLEAAEGLYGSEFQVSVNHNGSRLSEEQASEFNRRLLALIEEYFPPGKGDQSGIKYGFYGVFAPIDLHPLIEVKDEQ